jgi:hypothetical protein
MFCAWATPSNFWIINHIVHKAYLPVFCFTRSPACSPRTCAWISTYACLAHTRTRQLKPEDSAHLRRMHSLLIAVAVVSARRIRSADEGEGALSAARLLTASRDNIDTWPKLCLLFGIVNRERYVFCTYRITRSCFLFQHATIATSKWKCFFSMEFIILLMRRYFSSDNLVRVKIYTVLVRGSYYKQ